MNAREFNKALNTCKTRINKRLDPSKIKALPNDVKTAMVHFIVRNRQPIIEPLIPVGFDHKWLHSMGYLHRTEGKEFAFIHTCEHRVL